MKKFLIPVDFSDNSLKAVDFVINIAKYMDLEVKLVHINTFLTEPGLNPDVAMKILNDQKNEMNEAMRKVKHKFKQANIKASSLIDRNAFVSQGIVETADSYKADFIAMGTVGANNIIKKIMGSNTLSVVEQTNKRVFIVPNNIEVYDIKHILFVSELNQSIEACYVSRTKELAKLMNVDMQVLNIKNTEQYASINQINLEKELECLNVDIHNIESDKDILTILNNYVLDNNLSSLVVMTTYKLNFFKKLWSSNSIDKIFNGAKFPMLLYPLNE